MADSKITKKPHAAGFLAWRILGVSILLLVIPLFLQSFFLYKQEYNEKLKDVETDLKILAQERTHLIEEIIHMNWALLDSWSSPGSLGIRSSIIERIPTPVGVEEHFLVVSRSREALLVGKKETKRTSLVIPIPFKIIGRDMPRSYPVHILLMTGSGKVIWENQTSHTNVDILKVKDPILGTDFMIQLDVSTKDIHELHLESYFLRFAALVFFVGIIGGFLVYLLTRRIAKPLNSLMNTMQRVSEGASHARYKPDRMGFEINVLGIRFNETLDALLEHSQIAERERIRREKLANELHIGHEIQASLLPKKVPGFLGIDTASSYHASKEVNGDFYDLFPLKDGKLLVSVCDIAGKGIQACLFSLGLRSIIRSVASMTIDLEEIVVRANDLYLKDANDSLMFATLWIGIFDPKSKNLEYSSQGHPPALLSRKGKVEELYTQGIAIGAQTIDSVNTEKVKLKTEDVLVLYTDGIIEAHNPSNELFGKKRLRDLYIGGEKETSEQMVHRTIEAVHLFADGAMQHDDMTLLIIRLFKEM